MITSLICYVTIWNSPSDVTGTGVVDDGAKKDDKGNSVIGDFWLYQNTNRICVHIAFKYLTSVNQFSLCCGLYAVDCFTC